MHFSLKVNKANNYACHIIILAFKSFIREINMQEKNHSLILEINVFIIYIINKYV